jgi:pimeloyl-ACP methyl ester carboxylesterase
VQREISDALGYVTELPSGATVSGQNATVQECNPKDIEEEVGQRVPLLLAVDVQAGETRLTVPAGASEQPLELYKRVGGGLYVRLERASARAGQATTFTLPGDGRYVVRYEDALSHPEVLLQKLLDETPLSAEPEGKEGWWFARVAPSVHGPVPLILMHGAGTNRWKEFIHWATHSSQAELFRSQFQLWLFNRPSKGVNAAIGYSPDYPAFEDSIVAYLADALARAESVGVETDGVVYRFPAGPMGFVSHSMGGLVTQAFIANYPQYAERIEANVMLSAPLLGSPWATPQWLRHTLSRLGFSNRDQLSLFLERGLGDLALLGYISTERQGDLDMGWVNNDAAGGHGIPTETFPLWYRHENIWVTLSPRDANLSYGRTMQGYEDDSFEPPDLLTTYCGGLDEVLPIVRGTRGADKLFLYGSWFIGNERWQDVWERAGDGLQVPAQNLLENMALISAARHMGAVASAGDDALPGIYALSDGFVPLQSQLMLDGAEAERLYEATETAEGVILSAREDLLRAHTLARPDCLRLLPGWSHLDTVTGRYNKDTGESILFQWVAQDLLEAFPFD